MPTKEEVEKLLEEARALAEQALYAALQERELAELAVRQRRAELEAIPKLQKKRAFHGRKARLPKVMPEDRELVIDRAGAEPVTFPPTNGFPELGDVVVRDDK